MDFTNRKDASSSLSLNAEKDDTLGVLNMENLRVFGENSRNSSMNKDHINERLKEERAKAMETLKKASHVAHFKRPIDRIQSNKENEANNSERTPVLDRTDYVPYHRNKSINITDLVAEKTIHLESTDILSSATKSQVHKISFEPSEMTGRSTALSRDLKKEKNKRDRMLSVEEILASSCSADVRSLGESFRESCGSNMSLPRTADMSKSTQNSRDPDSASYSFSNAMRADESCFSSENFAPAELMYSKLMNDEMSWAQEYASIPANAVNDSLPQNESINSQRAQRETMLNSMVLDRFADPDFSLGNYFGKQSENIWNIVQTKSPVKGRAPMALVDSTITELDSGNISLTPKPDNKTYSKFTANRTSIEKKHESKDSGNATDNSYLLSVSAIERALVDIHTEDSDGSVVNRLLLAKKTKSCMNPYREEMLTQNEKGSKMLSLGGAIERVAAVNSNLSAHELPETILENKENYDPVTLSSMKYCDTLSFTESLLNSTDMKKANRSSITPRTPLSPIEVTNPIITVTDEAAEFGDLDEHPSLLEKESVRKVRRHKTVRDISPASTDSNKEFLLQDEQRKQKRSRSASREVERRGKTTPPRAEKLTPERSHLNSLSSTSSPNFSKPSAMLRHTTNGRSPSPAQFESPISSPRSCLSSQLYSPTWAGHSPQLDSTTNSDRRYLVGTLSSPDCGKFSLPSYALVGKTVSSASLKGRSTSRCSNSSEFSHRDGKLIPLKVTCLQLSWGSVRLRTNIQKSMQIKNTSSKRLVVKVDVAGPGFQIINSQGNLVTLQSQECRSVSLNFCPTVIGAAVGVLSFSPPNGLSNQTYLDVPLYGYGGTASLVPQNILKGPIGAPFLTMGELKELSGPIEKTFKIYNKGPLHGFAVMMIDSVGLDMPRLRDCIEVTPSKMLIPPESMASVRVTFRPRRDDIKSIIKKISNVMTLANLRIVCGDEPSRQRIRKLIRTMNEEDKSKFSSKSLDMVWASFPNERTVNDLDSLKEKSEVALDLISSLRIHEIALTLNHYVLDETCDSSLVFPDADETVVFRTFCSTSPSQMLDPVDEEDSSHEPNSESWSVRPNVLQFEPRMRFKIMNDFKQRKHFEVSCNYKHLFRFKPSEGYVSAGKDVDVEVVNQSEKPGILPTEQIDIWVYIQNERITIPVKVSKNYYPRNGR